MRVVFSVPVMESQRDGFFTWLHDLGFEYADTGTQSVNRSGRNDIGFAGVNGDEMQEWLDISVSLNGIGKHFSGDACLESDKDSGIGIMG